MNNVYENNIRLLPLLKFLDKYKIFLISSTILLLGIIVFFVINNQIQDKKSEQASDLYKEWLTIFSEDNPCLLYTSPSPRDATLSRMPSSA